MVGHSSSTTTIPMVINGVAINNQIVKRFKNHLGGRRVFMILMVSNLATRRSTLVGLEGLDDFCRQYSEAKAAGVAFLVEDLNQAFCDSLEVHLESWGFQDVVLTVVLNRGDGDTACND